MKRKNAIYAIIYRTLMVIILLAVGAYILLIANGYKINYRSRSIQKTGMIYLKSDPKDVNIYLDGKLENVKIPAKFSNLLPGRYDVVLKKNSYHDWQKTLYVEQGLVNAETDIILFLNNPQTILASDQEKEAFLKLPNPLLNTGLEIRNSSEIWQVSAKENSNLLITRLSQPIKKVAYYNDKKHILFQVNNEIHVIDLDGSNNIVLVKLSSDAVSNFFVDDSGETLYFQDGPDIKKAKIN